MEIVGARIVVNPAKELDEPLPSILEKD